MMMMMMMERLERCGKWQTRNQFSKRKMFALTLLMVDRSSLEFFTTTNFHFNSFFTQFSLSILSCWSRRRSVVLCIGLNEWQFPDLRKISGYGMYGKFTAKVSVFLWSSSYFFIRSLQTGPRISWILSVRKWGEVKSKSFWTWWLTDSLLSASCHRLVRTQHGACSFLPNESTY